jgi:hypothetical protein
MVNERDQHVFLHCFTGISRGPTILMCYFALFCRHPNWKDINGLFTQVNIVWKYASPNLEVVRRVLEEHQDIFLRSQQRYQIDMENESSERLRELEIDADSVAKM